MGARQLPSTRSTLRRGFGRHLSQIHLSATGSAPTPSYLENDQRRDLGRVHSTPIRNRFLIPRKAASGAEKSTPTATLWAGPPAPWATGHRASHYQSSLWAYGFYRRPPFLEFML